MQEDEDPNQTLECLEKGQHHIAGIRYPNRHKKLRKMERKRERGPELPEANHKTTAQELALFFDLPEIAGPRYRK